MRAHLWMWVVVGICSLLSLASSQTCIYPQLFHSIPHGFLPQILSCNLKMTLFLSPTEIQPFVFSLLIVYLLGMYGAVHE